MNFVLSSVHIHVWVDRMVCTFIETAGVPCWYSALSKIVFKHIKSFMISTYIFHDHIFEDSPVPKGVPLSDGDKPVPGEKNLHLIGLNLYTTEHSLCIACT